jgi:hypothetical protein
MSLAVIPCALMVVVLVVALFIMREPAELKRLRRLCEEERRMHRPTPDSRMSRGIDRPPLPSETAE